MHALPIPAEEDDELLHERQRCVLLARFGGHEAVFKGARDSSCRRGWPQIVPIVLTRPVLQETVDST